MKRRRVSKKWVYLLTMVSVFILLLVMGCATASSEQEDVIIRPAPIEDMQVNIAESDPPQVFVQIKGGLSDGCTTLHQVNTNRSGNSIAIRVTTQRPRKKACIEIYSTFVETVALGSDFVSGDTYVVKVNDVTKTFVMQ